MGPRLQDTVDLLEGYRDGGMAVVMTIRMLEWSLVLGVSCEGPPEGCQLVYEITKGLLELGNESPAPGERPSFQCGHKIDHLL